MDIPWSQLPILHFNRLPGMLIAPEPSSRFSQISVYRNLHYTEHPIALVQKWLLYSTVASITSRGAALACRGGGTNNSSSVALRGQLVISFLRASIHSIMSYIMLFMAFLQSFWVEMFAIASSGPTVYKQCFQP